VNSINEDFNQHTMKIKDNKEKDYEYNREKSLTVKFQ